MEKTLSVQVDFHCVRRARLPTELSRIFFSTACSMHRAPLREFTFETCFKRVGNVSNQASFAHISLLVCEISLVRYFKKSMDYQQWIIIKII